VAFDPQGRTLASGCYDNTVKLWEVRSGKLLHTLAGHQSLVNSVAFDLQGGMLASGSDDNTVMLWDTRSSKLLRTHEGHTGKIDIVAFSPDGRLLASKSRDHTIRLWSCETGKTVAVIPEPTQKKHWIPALVFHPTLPLLATVGSEQGTPDGERSRLIHLWELDYGVLLGQRTTPSISYTSAKVVLVGDSGVGKTGLGWRLAHGEFKEHASTHGQRSGCWNSSANNGATARIAKRCCGTSQGNPITGLSTRYSSTMPIWHSCSSIPPAMATR
jgi:WD40 repeat protein